MASKNVVLQDKVSSSNDQESAVIECRICHSKSTKDLILSPCLCKGSMAYVHYLCLERWLNYSCRVSCELCSSEFEVEAQRRYSLMQSLCIWIQHPANRTFIFCDFAICIVLTLLTLTLVAICSIGLTRFSQEENAHISSVWSQGVIDVVLVILLAGYLATVYSMARDHIRPWYSWWTRCQNIKLVLDKSKSQAIATPENICPHSQCVKHSAPTRYKSLNRLNLNKDDAVERSIINQIPDITKGEEVVVKNGSDLNKSVVCVDMPSSSESTENRLVIVSSTSNCRLSK